MEPLVLLRSLPTSSFSTLRSSHQFKSYFRNPAYCTSLQSETIKVDDAASISEYKPGFLDDLFLHLFRNKMVEEVGWNSEKPGYDGLIEVANRLMTKGRKNSDAVDASVRVLKSLFPPLLLELYRILVAPLAEGKVAAIMVARVTALTCQWLMGKCKVNSIDLPDGSSCESGVFVEKCKYLEESKCVGICINTCKLPTQTFFHQHMGVSLLMEPNFKDYSCQFKFGILPPQPEDDSAIREPCLEICPTASRRREITPSTQPLQCPKVLVKFQSIPFDSIDSLSKCGSAILHLLKIVRVRHALIHTSIGI